MADDGSTYNIATDPAQQPLPWNPTTNDPWYWDSPRRSQRASDVDPCTRAFFGLVVLSIAVYIIGNATNWGMKECHYIGNPPPWDPECWQG